MSFFARFEEINGELFRFDTRIYLNEFNPVFTSHCAGAIIGKNPGSAKPYVMGALDRLDLNGDKMLPIVRNRFLDAYKISNQAIPRNTYIRVWNLLYICDANLNSAFGKATKFHALPICSTEQDNAPIVWFGWGGNEPKLNPFKDRFIANKWKHQFYYSHTDSKVIDKQPSTISFAKHTQGMPSKPIIEYLAGIVGNYK